MAKVLPAVGHDQNIDVPSSGSAEAPITFAAYGSGPKPLLDEAVAVPGWDLADRWQPAGANLWYLTPEYNEHPGRLWLSGTEYVKAQTLAGVDWYYRWHYDPDPDETEAGRLYVWALDNPAIAYTDITKAWSKGYAINVNGKDHIVIQELDLRGGSYTVSVTGSDYVTIQNCEIGWGASSMGIYIGGLTTDGVVNGSDYGIIRHNRIDSGFRLTYKYEKAQTEEGIHLRGSANHWEIHDNEIHDWGHNAIALWQHEPGTSVNHNKVYRNYMSAAHISYGRGFGTSGRLGGCAYKEFYHNIVRYTSVTNQIGGDHNRVYGNVIDTIFESPVVPGRSDGFSVHSSQYGETEYVADDNEISNNIIYDTPGPGINVWTGVKGMRLPATGF